MADFAIHVGSRSAQGVRPNNEDSFAVDLVNKLFLVADGMGGQERGEQASGMAADIIPRVVRDRLAAQDSAGEAVQRALAEANDAIVHAGRDQPSGRRMGTTAVVALQREDRVYVAGLGDSRAYLVRNDRAFQLTKDQSLTQGLVDAGELTEEEAETNVRRNIILQALGPDPKVRVVLSTQELRRNDVLVVCSDGLSGLVKKEEIAERVVAEHDLAKACSQLIEMANERGGPDNITVVMARFLGDGLRAVGDESEPGHKVLRLPGSAANSDESLPAVDAVTPTEPSIVPVRDPADDAPSSRIAIWGIAAAVLAAAIWFLFR